MDKDNVISFYNRELFADPLTDLIRTGARQLIAQAVEAEVNELMAQYDGQHTESGHRAVVRSGYQRQRQIQTGIGSVTAKIPKVRSTSGAPVTFRSWLIPPYVRKTRTLEAFLPWLYLKGISSGEMGEVLGVLLGQGSERIFRRGGVATESGVGRRARTVDGAGFEQGAMGIPVGGWDIQRIAQRGCQVVFTGGDRRE